MFGDRVGSRSPLRYRQQQQQQQQQLPPFRQLQHSVVPYVSGSAMSRSMDVANEIMNPSSSMLGTRNASFSHGLSSSMHVVPPLPPVSVAQHNMHNVNNNDIDERDHSHARAHAWRGTVGGTVMDDQGNIVSEEQEESEVGGDDDAALVGYGGGGEGVRHAPIVSNNKHHHNKNIINHVGDSDRGESRPMLAHLHEVAATSLDHRSAPQQRKLAYYFQRR
jgi:hypothetical protein